MFSVPGWNISTSIATQAEKPKPLDPSKEGKKAKKRRQKHEDQINEGDLGDYFNKISSGVDTQDAQGVVNAKGPEANGSPAPIGEESQEKRGKKRKRKNNKAAKEEGKGEESAGATNNELPVPAESPVADSTTPRAGETKRDKKKQKKDPKPTDSQTQNASTSNEISKAPAPVSLLPPEPKGLTPLQKSMRLKLASARFRHLNEALYTKPSDESLSLFKEDPTMFEDYHRGFAQQVEVWPENPVDSYVNTIIARGKLRTKDPWKDKKRKEKKGKSNPGEAIDSTPSSALESSLKPLPRNLKSQATIADLGCGTASLSHRLQPHLKSLNMTLHSFDLSKPTGPSAPLVTVADISALPLPDNSVDVAIFCLALMGTNWLDFIDEAWRILRWKGELWVAEIKSRFGRVERRKAGQAPINSIGSLRKSGPKPPAKSRKGKEKPEEEGIQGSDDEKELAHIVDGQDGQEGTDVSSFVAVLEKHGFVLDALPERQSDAIDLSNKMFVKLQFVKGVSPAKGKNAKKEGAAFNTFNKNSGGGALRMGIKGKKFTAVSNGDDDGGDEVDAKTLKPCLYKIR
ncbi:unnamed protein product [Periconia digitata]|uniref:Ribosomal RNA-processing protein 8 n=1 Tax=Periconia digitata TaxID=1303443 RepID=A0A9W4UJB5_9PLEO|nr:unnamed protein product [Periconia digitata]